MLITQIKHIKKDLSKYADKTKEELLTLCINNKLEATLEKYNREIELNSEYIQTRSSFRVLKALTKLQKRADKGVLEAIAKEGESNE